jgi:hypothetical protein
MSDKIDFTKRIECLERQGEHERGARDQAERIVEQRMSALWSTNKELKERGAEPNSRS